MDWKRANQIDKGYLAQVSAYAEALRVMLGHDEMPLAYVCKLPKLEGEDIDMPKQANIPDGMQFFLGAKRFHETDRQFKI